MNNNLETSELINVKLAKLLTNVDDYLRGKDVGLFNGTAATDGILFAATAVVVGALGFATSMHGDIPILSSINDIANNPILHIGQKDISLTQMIGATGAFIGLEFSLLSKIFRSIVGTVNTEVPGYFDCVTKSGNETIVSRNDIMKSVETGEFYSKYDSIRIAKGRGFEDFYPTHGDIEPVSTLPYYMKEGFDPNAAVHFSKDSSKDVEVVRRICFKETQNLQKAHTILNRINGIRDSYQSLDTDKSTNKSLALK